MKTLAVLLALLLVASAVHAREIGIPTWGVKWGFTGANMYGDSTGTYKAVYGVVFGAYVEYPITSLISVQGELLYSMRGWKDTEICPDCELNHKTGYVEIPVLLRFNSPIGGPAAPYLIMGPSIGIKTNDDLEFSIGGVTADIEMEEYELESTEFAIVLGGGMEILIAQYAISVEARTSVGLTDAYKEQETVIEDVTKQKDAKNVTVSLVLGYAF